MEWRWAPRRTTGLPGQRYPTLGIGCLLPDLGTGHDPGVPGSLVGRIDEVAGFHHALTAEQMWQLYTGSAAPARTTRPR